ncbi:MAG TPA: inositol monophosphatase family protein [Anaerolineae bacterium]|nr:inositol monophosphatase family protein [Anaerolineae bacterium]
MNINAQQILNQALPIAHAAGAILRGGQQTYTQTGHTTTDAKSTSIDLVTQYDTAAEKEITTQLQQTFPTHGLIGEEGTHHNPNAPLTWYIDPLDGTTNFAHGLPHFAVSMALYHHTQPLVAIVYNPMTDECYTATHNGGAHLHHAGTRRQLHVSTATTLGHSLLATGYPYDRHTSPRNNIAQTAALLLRAQGLRRAGAAALDLAYVAAGRLDGYWEFKLKPWDCAAGILLVTEAGGTVTAINGASVPVTTEPALHIIASTPHIYQELFNTLQETLT